MEDAELQRYIPLAGDRIGLRNFLNPRATSSGNSTGRKDGLMEKLRKRLRQRTLPSEPAPGEEAETSQKTANATKDTRKIFLGWFHFNNSTNEFAQVRSKKGGGTRDPAMKKSDKREDIIARGVALFFSGWKIPNGQY